MSSIYKNISGFVNSESDTDLQQSTLDTMYGDPFWSQNPKILFELDNLANFIPNAQMTTIEKMNALMRLSIYLSLALFLFTSNTSYLFIAIITAVITYFIFEYQKKNSELFLNSYKGSQFNKIQESLIEEPSEIKPTTENPFMNINLITGNKAKEQAPKTWNDENLQEKVEEKFNYNLYRDVGDLYGKRNSQRQYYQVPSTTIPNNQTQFAKWLYATGPTCKETSVYCAPQIDPVPYIDNTNVLRDFNQKY